ncbi:MAG TPA: prepilin peptidase [Bacteriovoracaceae bacterium]|nr:prepilin peptidase [Bacteriovoracaceae bacterium]
MINLFLYSFIAIQLFIVAWIDLKTKVISNYWHLLNLLVAIVIYVVQPDTFKWEVFLFPLGYVLTGFMLFLAGIMGAGDSKYLASLCLVIPLEFHLPFFEALLLTTMMVGALLLSSRIVKNFQKLRAYAWTRYWQGIKDVIKSEFSYAPVIFLAWIYLGVSLWV